MTTFKESMAETISDLVHELAEFEGRSDLPNLTKLTQRELSCLRHALMTARDKLRKLETRGK